ncbi:TetR family transcriptional regulator [Amycolatopsis thailandensis]|uniref:TetR family transcriptional regulator n=1 Tax=Amycolatopsis thailandensis TaxID=589330 RepID=A0A229SF95_9PSEU|nr:TetR/AcrR family transcriptional regulator [Amycolatopsis thailandensis]OXM57419.1 TetR family transcriptional regulator [Amycolatopsis thailandensis]
MVRRTDTRQRMLDSAAELFHQQGYHATGLNQLVAAVGAPKGSLYFHFPGGKEQLAAEAIRQSADRLCDQLRTIVASSPDVITGIENVVDALAKSLEESNFQRGCPLATVALDASGDSEEIRRACADGYTSWHTLIAEALNTDKAAHLATVVLAAVEGGLLLAKTLHDTAPLRAIAPHLRTTLERELP